MIAASRTLAVAAVLAAAVLTAPAHAYLKLGAVVEDETVSLKWRAGTIAYFVADDGVPNVTAAEFQAAVQRGFDTWNAVETAETDVQFAGFTNLLPFEIVRQRKRGHHAVRQARDLLARTDARLQDGELVAAQPRHHVMAPHQRVQALGHAAQHLVAGAVP